MVNNSKNCVIVPLVLHRIVHEPLTSSCEFEDVTVTTFNQILTYCLGSGGFLNLSRGLLAEVNAQSKSYLLTFDDGCSSDAEIVLPILINFGISAIFFLIADRIDTSNYLTSSQVRLLADSGMVIGSHSKSHPDMTRLTVDSQRLELLHSKRAIEEICGHPVRYFSFPYGKFNPFLIHLAFEAGYDKVFTSRHGIVDVDTKIIPRNSINGSMSWLAIHRSLSVSAPTRMIWGVEDFCKDTLKNIFGDDLYRTIRNISLPFKGK
jgi:peptidoglycan/xylan/chitin deacetylase (PgdA/CDA1 family)